MILKSLLKSILRIYALTRFDKSEFGDNLGSRKMFGDYSVKH